MENRISVKVPIELITYLNEKIKISKPTSATRWMAFEDLIQRYLVYQAHDDDMAINVQQLSDSWEWSRKRAMRFLKKLQEANIIDIDTVVVNKVVRLRPDIICYSDYTQITEQKIERCQEDLDHPNPSFSMIGSSSDSEQACSRNYNTAVE